MSDEISSLDEMVRLAEALVFASAAPVSARTLTQALPDGADVDAVIAALKERYAGRGVELAEVGGGLQFRTAADLAPRLKRVVHVPRRLPRAAMETLAIVAYHQPVTRAEIEEIRGVALSRGILDTLMEAGWVRPKGHRASPGRPATWVTTPEFLLQFGLDSLAELPGVEELKAAGLLDARMTTSLGDTSEDAPMTEDGEDSEERSEQDAVVEELFPDAEER